MFSAGFLMDFALKWLASESADEFALFKAAMSSVIGVEPVDWMSMRQEATDDSLLHVLVKHNRPAILAGVLETLTDVDVRNKRVCRSLLSSARVNARVDVEHGASGTPLCCFVIHVGEHRVSPQHL